jgi:hypothetical protein
LTCFSPLHLSLPLCSSTPTLYHSAYTLGEDQLIPIPNSSQSSPTPQASN